LAPPHTAGKIRIIISFKLKRKEKEKEKEKTDQNLGQNKDGELLKYL